MQDYVHSGYYGLFRPPYSLTNQTYHSTIYCVSDRLNTILVIIPLVTSFYKDVLDIVRTNSSQTVYLIVPDIGIPFISDYYQVWYTITKVYHRKCQIFTKYMPENSARADFIADIISSENDNISFDVKRSDIDVGTIDVTLTRDFVNSSSPYSCDVILNDTYKKRLFVGEMNNEKAKYLDENRNLFDEIHMPFITGIYDGMTYNDLIRNYPAIVSKTICNQFGSIEEYEYATSRSIPIGEGFNNDFI